MLPEGLRPEQYDTERDRLAAEATEILNRSGDTLSTDGQAAYDERMADLEELRRRAKNHTRLERLAGQQIGENSRTGGARRPQQQHDRDDTPTGPTEAHRDAARLLARARHLGDELPDRLARMCEADPSGRNAAHVNATASPEYARAWAKVLADPSSGHQRHTTEEAAAWQRALATSPNGDGGYAVPTHLDPQIALSSDGVTDPVRQVARVVTLSVGNVWHGVTSAGVTSRWAGEGTESNDDSPTLAGPEIPVVRGDSFVPVTMELLQDATSVDSQLRTLFADSKAVKEAATFLTGSGVGEPTGLVTALAGGASVVNTATAATFADADVYSMIEALPARFRANAAWLASLGVLNVLDAAETSAGAKKWPSLDGTPPRLLRKAIHEVSGLADDPTVTGNRPLLVGDFRSGYTIVDRLGARVELVPHLFGANGRPLAERGILFVWRTGADVVIANALRMLEVA